MLMTLWTIGKLILLAGAALLVVGGVLMLLYRLGLTRLPGTLTWRRGGLTIVLPLGAMIVLSLLLTIVVNLLLRR